MLSENVQKPMKDMMKGISNPVEARLGRTEAAGQRVRSTKDSKIRKIKNISNSRPLSAEVDRRSTKARRSEGLFPSDARLLLHCSLVPVENRSIPTSQTT